MPNLPDDSRSHTILTTADATVMLVDRQIERLERLLAEVRQTEVFFERRSRDRGRFADRRR